MRLMIGDMDLHHSSTSMLEYMTLDMDTPQFVSVQGPNGIKKSILIRCIYKIFRPMKGYVPPDGNDVNGITRKEQAKNKGHVPNSAIDTFPFMLTWRSHMRRWSAWASTTWR